MGKESILLGIVGIVLGIGIYVKTRVLTPALIPLVIGISLIFLNKEEGKIEQREDINTKKIKK